MVPSRTISTLKVWLAGLVCRPGVGRGLSALFSGRVPNRGVQIDVTHESVPPEHIACIFFGLYEQNELRFVRRFLRRDLDVVEIGSGIGVVSAHILTKLTRGTKLACVEANPFLIPALRRNVELNGSGAEVMVLGRALDYGGSETVAFRVDSKNLGSAVQEQSGRDLVEVRTASLYDVVCEAGVGDYALVCDAEGAEAGMILSDSAGLSGCKQMIIELHPAVHEGRSYSVADLRRHLEAHHGFSLVAFRHGVHVFERAEHAR